MIEHKTIQSMNSKGQLHGYQELYFGSNLTIRTMCKNGGLVGYLENHYDKITRFHIR